MKGLLLALAGSVAAACGAGDDVAGGARASCAAGGVLTDCADAQRTAEAACWRLVDCGAIPVERPGDNEYDWGECVDDLQSQPLAYHRAIVNCIAASSCDQLRPDGAPDSPNRSQIYCLQLGDR